VRQLIRSEALKIGDPLPSEAAIGEQLGVSRAVVREAYR
jgi:GntR family transcriptional regulator, transcriptional repressor for pyruvate dehydrogenase complex